MKKFLVIMDGKRGVITAQNISEAVAKVENHFDLSQKPYVIEWNREYLSTLFDGDFVIGLDGEKYTISGIRDVDDSGYFTADLFVNGAYQGTEKMMIKTVGGKLTTDLA